jgi:hypothetical protein
MSLEPIESSPPPPRRSDAAQALGARWAPMIVLLAAVLVFAVVSARPAGIDVGRRESPPVATIASRVPRLRDLVPGYTDELRVALASPATSERWLLRWAADDHAPAVMPLGEAGAVAFDVSGQHVAALRAEDGGGLLTINEVGGRGLPIAARVLGFAWHDREPARLAWTERGSDEVASLVVAHATSLDVDEIAEVALRPLRRFGDWGFALLIGGAPGAGYRFELREPSGAVGAEEIVGYPFGAVPGGGLGVTTLEGPGSGGAVVVDPTDGATQRLPLEPGSFAWEAVADPAGGRLAVYQNSAWLFGVDEVALVKVLAGDGETITAVEGVSRPPAVGWSSDGRFLVAATASTEGPQVTFYDTATGARTEVPIEFPARATYVMDLASAG